MALGDECPAIKELKAALKASFPSVDLQTTNKAYPGTRHTSGIAMDIMLDIREPREKAIADGIIEALKSNYSAMKWSDIVYSDWKSDGSIYYYHIPGGGRGYGGKPQERNDYSDDQKHTDHIHIDWVDFGQKNVGDEYLRNPYKWSDAAMRTGFSAALVKDLQAAAQAQTSPAAGGQVPSWLWGWWTITQDGEKYYYYFGLAGFVDWTDVKPRNAGAPMVNPQNKGIFTFSSKDGVSITWDEVGGASTKEVFKTGASGQRQMKGTSNRGGDLVASKI